MSGKNNFVYGRVTVSGITNIPSSNTEKDEYYFNAKQFYEEEKEKQEELFNVFEYSILSSYELHRLKEYQRRLIGELDKILPYYDYKKDKKIKLDFSSEVLKLLIFNLSLIEFVDLRSILLEKPCYLPVKYLRIIDLSSINFNGMNVTKSDFSYTNVNIDPKTVRRNSLYQTNLEGIIQDSKFLSSDTIEIISNELSEAKNWYDNYTEDDYYKEFNPEYKIMKKAYSYLK